MLGRAASIQHLASSIFSRGVPQLSGKERKKEIQACAALYALGALTQPEAREFETLLTDIASGAAEEASAFQSVVASLGLSVPERSPSESLREKLMARVAEK